MARNAAGPQRTDNRLAAARQHFFADRWEEALRLCRTIGPEHPDHPEALHLEALIALQADRPDRARILLDQAIRHAPSNPSLHNSRGSLHFQARNWRAAETDFRAAVVCAPSLPEPLVNLGNVLHAQGRAAEAETVYRCALRLSPDDPTVLNNLGTALRDQARLSKALRHFRRALDIAPESAEALFNQADIHLLQKRCEDAESGFRRVAEAAPAFVPASVGLAQSLLCRRRSEEATAVLQHLQTTAPEHPAVQETWRSVFASLVKPERLRRMLDPGLSAAMAGAIDRRVGAHTRVVASGDAVLPAALLAARAGAAWVALCEPDRALARLFEQVIADNGLRDRVTVFAKPSVALHPERELGAPADLLLWDPIAPVPLSTAALFPLRHALAELLTPGAGCLPSGVRVLMQLVNVPDTARITLPIAEGGLSRPQSELDLSLLLQCRPAGPRALSPASEDAHALGPVVEALCHVFGAATISGQERTLTLATDRTGRCSGVLVRIELFLDAGTVYSSDRVDGRPLWWPAYHRLPVPVDVAAGHALSVTVRLDSGGLSLRLGS